jgi:TctA family transporter
VGTIILAAFAPPLTEIAFKFGPAEYFSLMILGLIGAVVLASGSLLKAVGMIVLGLLLGMVGTDVNSGVARYSFDIPELTDGIDFVVIAMGVFGYGEIIANLSKPDDEREVFTAKVKGLMPTKEDFKRCCPPCCAARCWVRPWVSCPAAAPCCRPSLPTPSKRRPSCVRAKCPSAKAISVAWRRLSRPTTPVRRPRSFRC